MAYEKIALLAAVFLGLIQVFASAFLSTKQRGAKWNISSRDQTMPPLTGYAGRMDRALQNFKETFPFFVAAVFLAHANGVSGIYSQWGSILYVVARTFYIPLYLLNVRIVRSLVWLISILGIVAVLAQNFLD